MKKKFCVINSFAAKKFGGNPAAIFANAKGLSNNTMQQIAKQLNLVETVFLVKSSEEGVDFDFRYFTPNKEIEIAGHPTIAAFVALLEKNIITCEKQSIYHIKTHRGIQQIKLIRENNKIIILMKCPTPQFNPIINERTRVAEVLGIETDYFIAELPFQVVDTGLNHLIVPVKSLNALLKIQRKTKQLKELCDSFGAKEVQAFTFDTTNENSTIHTRNLCPREGIEDPACGVGNSAVGAYLLKNYYKKVDKISYKAEQGHIVNMPSIVDVHASFNNEVVEVSIGGYGNLMIEGTFMC